MNNFYVEFGFICADEIPAFAEVYFHGGLKIVKSREELNISFLLLKNLPSKFISAHSPFAKGVPGGFSQIYVSISKSSHQEFFAVEETPLNPPFFKGGKCVR